MESILRLVTVASRQLPKVPSVRALNSPWSQALLRKMYEYTWGQVKFKEGCNFGIPEKLSMTSSRGPV